jgi:paraquat-inducible protein B
MAERSDRDDLPQATVTPKRRGRISVVWIIPILAAAVALGIAVQRILSEGPTITIVFKAPQGIEAGKTLVKYKDVTIGQVTAVQLAADYSRVEVRAKIAKSAAGLMVEDAKFWVVEPRITLGGVSGLGTLLSGNFIGFEVGKSGKRQRQFTGLDAPLIITSGQPGRPFVLKAENLGSLGIGSPVYYRRLPAGQVIAYSLAGDGRAVDLQIFVNAPYDRFVKPGTRFWNASGVDISVGAGGVDVRTESVVALLAGGVAFDTPTFAPPAEPAAADFVFTLYGDRITAMKQPESDARHYVLYFTESLRGLSVGAPVTLLGLPGGQVTDVGLDLNPATLGLRGRVEVVAFPERLIAALRAQQAVAGEAILRSNQQRHAFFDQMVEKRGMRAQLRTGSLLSGQLYVALDYFPDAPPAKVDWSQDPTVLPTVPSTIPDLEAKLAGIVAELDKLPYEAIGADITKALVTLNQTLQDASRALNAIDADVTPGLKASLEELRRVLASADGVLKGQAQTTLADVNTTLEELRRVLATADASLKSQVNTALDELRGTLSTANRVLQEADGTLLGKNAPIQQELRDALQEVTRAARSLRVLTDYLERHPDSLIRGKTEEKR